MHTILMIEDDLEITELLEEYLKRYSIYTLSVSKPSIALDKLKAQNFDLILLDLSLPEMDGLELCKIIKTNYPNIPIIISTARADVSDKVVAFEYGADDYIAKPYEPRELVARIQAHIKRYKNFQINPNSKKFILDEAKMQVLKDNKPLNLTLAEYEIFALLIKRAGEVVSREYIANSIDSIKWDSSDRTIDVIISRIRHKIRDNPKEPKYIKSIRAIGYKFIG